jgi:hypothetical protein
VREIAVSATHIPPQNIEAEESVLGAMMVAAPTLIRVIDEVGLEASDFYLERHRVIFEAIRDLHVASKPVDELTVCAALGKSIDEAGGKHYVSELAAKVPAAGNAAYYAEIVQREAGLYRLLQAGQGIVELVNEGGDAVELVKAASEAVEAAEIKGAPKLVRTADISRVKPIRWAWNGRLLLGYLNLLLGAEGVGKGTLTAWLIRQVTRGELPGDLYGKPSRVLILGDEDGFDSVWVPRLYAAGADLDLVDTLEGEFDLGMGAAPLRFLVNRHDYKLVFFDQLLDNLGVDVDDWRAKDIRERLRPLRRVARELDVLMLGALHPNKGQRSSFRDLVSGSHAFNALSRSSLLLAQHPDDEHRRVLVRGKGNLSAPPPSFEFTIEARDLEITATVSACRWQRTRVTGILRSTTSSSRPVRRRSGTTSPRKSTVALPAMSRAAPTSRQRWGEPPVTAASVAPSPSSRTKVGGRNPVAESGSELPLPPIKRWQWQ